MGTGDVGWLHDIRSVGLVVIPKLILVHYLRLWTNTSMGAGGSVWMDEGTKYHINYHFVINFTAIFLHHSIRVSFVA